MTHARLAAFAALAAIGAAAPAASAQLIVPTSQVREIRGEGNWMDAAGGVFGTGPMVISAVPGDYGLWSDTLFVPGFISGPGTQTGGFNGFDTFSLDAITMSLGGGNGPGTSADADLAIEFTYTFTLPEPVTYTTSANISVAGPSTVPDTVVNFVATYSLTGPGGEVFSHQTSEENAYSIAVADATGTLPAGSYTLSFLIDGEVSFVAPAGGAGNGAGGGAGGPSPILLFTVAPAGDCPADWNNDTLVNSTDISAFLTAWLDSVQNGNLIADFDGNLMVNSSDISAFLTAWLTAVQQGC